jgi:hypothetical protein
MMADIPTVGVCYYLYRNDEPSANLVGSHRHGGNRD